MVVTILLLRSSLVWKNFIKFLKIRILCKFTCNDHSHLNLQVFGLNFRTFSKNNPVKNYNFIEISLKSAKHQATKHDRKKHGNINQNITSKKLLLNFPIRFPLNRIRLSKNNELQTKTVVFIIFNLILIICKSRI